MRRGKGLRILAVALACCLAAGNVVSTSRVTQVYADTQASISQTEKSMLVGDTFQLKILGIDDTKATYSWSSSTPSVATVNARGNVTGVGYGSAVINCKITKSDKTTVTVSCLVTVRTRVAANSVSINNANYQVPNAHVMVAGGVYNFNASVSPSDSTDKVFWEVADADYAIVTSDGQLTALRPGITRLIAYAGQTETAARAESNKVVDEIYIYIKGSENEVTATPFPTPTTPPYIFGSTPIPTPTPTPIPSATPIPTPSVTPGQTSGQAKVDSVNLVSADTLQIVFGKPVIPSYVIGNNGTLTSSYISIAATQASASYGTLRAELSQDQRTLTIKASGKFDGSYVVMIMPGILTTDGSTVERYVQTMKLKDTTGPVYLGTDLDIKGYYNTIRFNEEIDITNLAVVAVASSCEAQTHTYLLDATNYVLNEDKTSLSIDLSSIDIADENKELMIGINGITDIFGNRTSPSVLTVTLKTDTKLRAPGQVVSIERVGIYEVHVRFDSPLFDAGYLILGRNKLSGIVSQEDECVGIFFLEGDEINLTGSQVVGVTGWYSYYAYGAANNTVSRVVDFSVPTTAPYLTGMKLTAITDGDGSSALELVYDRPVTLNESVGSFNASLRASNGDITPLSVTYVGEVSGNKVTLTIYSGQMNRDGIYTITLPNGFVKDLFEKVSAGNTFALTMEHTSVLGKLEEPKSVEQDKTNSSVIYVKFPSRVDEASAVTVSNYVLGNYVNPIRAELTEQGIGGATVKLTFKEGSIPYDAEYPLKIGGVKGYGDTLTMDVYETEIALIENIAPVYASAYFDSDSEIVLTFFESSALSGIPDFSVSYNGRNIAWFSYINNNTVRIYLSESVTRGRVTVMATSACQITDTYGNVATLNGTYEVVR